LPAIADVQRTVTFDLDVEGPLEQGTVPLAGFGCGD
jgi:hypothetical protein